MKHAISGMSPYTSPVIGFLYAKWNTEDAYGDDKFSGKHRASTVNPARPAYRLIRPNGYYSQLIVELHTQWGEQTVDTNRRWYPNSLWHDE